MELESLKQFWFINNITKKIDDEITLEHFPTLFYRFFDYYLQSKDGEDLQAYLLSFNYLTKSNVTKINIGKLGILLNENFNFRFSVEKSEELEKILDDEFVNLTNVLKLNIIYTFQILERYTSSTRIEIKLDPYLSKLNIREIQNLKVIPREYLDQGKPKYDFDLIATLSDGSTLKAESNDLYKDEPFLRVKNSYYVIPLGLHDYIKKQHKLVGLDADVAKRILDDPLSVIPENTDIDLIDLSEYDKRVLGFQHYKPSKQFKIKASPVNWNYSNGAYIPYLSLATLNNEDIQIPIDLKELERIKTRLEIYLKDDSKEFPQKAVEIPPYGYIESSYDNLAKIAYAISMIKKEEKKPPSEGKGKLVAIVGNSDREETPQLEFPNFSKEELESVMKSGELKPHQVEGINWMLNSYFNKRGGVLLADDMGLGKTLQILVTITIIKNLHIFPKIKAFHKQEEDPVLIVAPVILLSNWFDEINKFIKDQLLSRVLVFHGNNIDRIKEQGIETNWQKQFDVIITNYDSFSNLQKPLLKKYFSINIFDESQHIKNHKTAKSRAARGLKSNFSILATGTPVENTLEDVWAQISALNRPINPLGPVEEFDFKDNLEDAKKLRAKLLMDTPEAIILRRDKGLLRKQGILKNKIELDPFYVSMDKYQIDNEDLILTTHKSRPLERIQKLSKLYQHKHLLIDTELEPMPDWLLENSPKLTKTLEIIDQYIKPKNEKVLIFTHFREMQDILKLVIQKHFDIKVNIINGETNTKGKEVALKIIENFSKHPGFNILILSPLAAGAGLNITAANHVIHYGRWWNPAKEDQATDRSYRIGQTKDVYVYYPILLKDGMNGFDKILHYEVIKRKKLLADNFLMPSKDVLEDVSND